MTRLARPSLVPRCLLVGVAASVLSIGAAALLSPLVARPTLSGAAPLGLAMLVVDLRVVGMTLGGACLLGYGLAAYEPRAAVRAACVVAGAALIVALALRDGATALMLGG